MSFYSDKCYLIISYGSFKLCHLSQAGTSAPKIPFSGWYQASVGHRGYFVPYLKGGNEAAVIFVCSEGWYPVPGTKAFVSSSIWFGAALNMLLHQLPPYLFLQLSHLRPVCLQLCDSKRVPDCPVGHPWHSETDTVSDLLSWVPPCLCSYRIQPSFLTARVDFRLNTSCKGNGLHTLLHQLHQLHNCVKPNPCNKFLILYHLQ